MSPELKLELEEIKSMRDEDIVFDEDCPELTDKDLKKFYRVNPRTPKEWEQYYKYNPRVNPKLKRATG